MLNNSIFHFSERFIITDDTIDTLLDIIQNSGTVKCGIFFNFIYPEKSLRYVKYIIQEHLKDICFSNLYFFNAYDYINEIVGKPIYLPKNINLFINESCFIGCNYCHNKNQIHQKISFTEVQNFLQQYPLADTMNFNIIGQGDPLFHPEIFSILEYIKSFGGHITFFSGGKSLLYCKDIVYLESLVDEFKINLSSSNALVYNQMHSLKITDAEFQELVQIIGFLGNKVTLITVLMHENIHDLLEFYKLAISTGATTLEIKRDVFYPKNYILDNPIILKKIEFIINKFIAEKKMNIITNFLLNSVFISHNFHQISPSLVEMIIQNTITQTELPDDLEVCHQFGNSLDITERGIVSVCCKYDIGNISTIDYTAPYYEHELFQEKYHQFRKKTPEGCKNCPMPIDRYKNFLKSKFIKEL